MSFKCLALIALTVIGCREQGRCDNNGKPVKPMTMQKSIEPGAAQRATERETVPPEATNPPPAEPATPAPHPTESQATPPPAITPQATMPQATRPPTTTPQATLPPQQAPAQVTVIVPQTVAPPEPPQTPAIIPPPFAPALPPTTNSEGIVVPVVPLFIDPGAPPGGPGNGAPEKALSH